jgi:DNA polymerase (family 10)
MLRIIRHAAGRGCFLELNAHPERLDLPDSSCQEAKRAGVLVSINSDSHSVHGFANLLRHWPSAPRLARSQGHSQCAAAR